MISRLHISVLVLVVGCSGGGSDPADAANPATPDIATATDEPDARSEADADLSRTGDAAAPSDEAESPDEPEPATGPAPCESLYAAAVAEETGCGCETPFDVGGCTLPSSLPDDTTGCVDSETPNACALRIYDDAEEAVGLSGSAPGATHTGLYLPRCSDGTDGPCPGQEARCIDGTRPVVYAAAGGSNTWVISMGGEGGPCAGENCWASYYESGGTFRKSLSTSTPWDGPPAAGKSRGGVQTGKSTFGGKPNPFVNMNRVFFERCGEFASDGDETIQPAGQYAGPTRVFHHGLRTTATLFQFLSSPGGTDLGGAQLPSLMDADTVLVTGGSDAAKWLIFGADRLAEELAVIAPNAQMMVVFDSILGPMLEGEHGAQYPYDAALDKNGNGENDIFDHIRHNPDGATTPNSAVAYDDQTFVSGLQHQTLTAHRIPLDTTCLEAHADDPSPCYDKGHVALNHVETPHFVIMDLSDGVVRSSAWTNSFDEWKTPDYRPRVRAQGVDMVRFAPGPGPGVWMPDFGHHVYLLTNSRLEKRMSLCDGDIATTQVDLATALHTWMLGEQIPDAVSGYERPSGLTWQSSPGCL